VNDIKCQTGKFSVISWREQVTFCGDDGDTCLYPTIVASGILQCWYIGTTV